MVSENGHSVTSNDISMIKDTMKSVSGRKRPRIESSASQSEKPSAKQSRGIGQGIAKSQSLRCFC